MKSFMEIGPHVFEKSGRQTDRHTHTHRRGNFIYIDVRCALVSRDESSRRIRIYHERGNGGVAR